MKMFEYKKDNCRYNEDVIEKLNNLGQEGWERCSLIPYGQDKNGYFIYLKREI